MFKKLAAAFVVVALLTVASAAMAKGNKTHQPKPRVSGEVTTVTKDGDTLKSFVIKVAKSDKTATITVTDTTTYARPNKVAATAADIAVGAKVKVTLTEALANDAGTAKSIIITKDAPAANPPVTPPANAPANPPAK